MHGTDLNKALTVFYVFVSRPPHLSSTCNFLLNRTVYPRRYPVQSSPKTLWINVDRHSCGRIRTGLSGIGVHDLVRGPHCYQGIPWNI